jgi:hypothetical protein
MAGPKDNRATSDASTAKGTRSKTTPADLSGVTQEINNASQGRRFLEGANLLVPIGGDLTASSLATTLFHAAELGAALPAKNAMRSVAYLILELQTEAEARQLAESVESQIEKIHEKLSSTVNLALEEVKSVIESNSAETRKLMDEVASKNAQSTQSAIPSYRDVLARGSDLSKDTAADPRLVAREEIKKRQVLLDIDSNDDRFRTADATAILKDLNEAVAKIDDSSGKDRRFSSARKLGNGGILAEMRSEGAAKWFQRKDTVEKFKVELRVAVSLKKRTHNCIAFFVPLTLDPGNPEHIEEIQESNDIAADTIIRAKWAKAPERRTPSQSCGHLIISFTDPDAANRAILNGLIICNKRVTIQKSKKEPLRCLKCHGWNHVAARCSKQTDVCGTCGREDHRTGSCTVAGIKKCVSCDADDHSSWDRNCPVSRDVNETAAIVYEAKKTGGASGVLIFGGGSPKNFILQTEPQIQEVLGLDEAGHDYFVQVTDARPDTGGLSGATPGEAVSWGKVDPEKLPGTVVVYGDTTIIAPLLTAYALTRHEPRPLRRLYDRRDAMLDRLRSDFLAKGGRD